MPGSSTVVVVRPDLSIPGADEDKVLMPGNAAEIERKFFELVRDSRPDVVVLDISNSEGGGIEAIRKIRHRVTVPILVVCRPDDVRVGDYRIAGAAECMSAPVDIMVFNEMILRIKRLTRPESAGAPRHQEAVTFAGIAFRPANNTLSDSNGAVVRLTTAEQVLMSQFVARPWTICSRAEIGEMLYGRHRPKSDRAIDVIVARLRKKLASLVGPSAEDLVQTKHRWGYMLAADVSAARQPDELPIPSYGVRDGGPQSATSAEA
jgi:two-component system, OmpR family, response regulator